MSIATAVEHIADTIATQTGLRAVADPRQIVLPCVLVNPPKLDFGTLAGEAAQAEVTVMLLVPGPYNLDALAQLSAMLEEILDVSGMAPPDAADPVQYTTATDTRIPGYQLTYRMAVAL
jgi:hypothetical protein